MRRSWLELLLDAIDRLQAVIKIFRRVFDT